jgi:phosphoribosylformylglycinamidine cyclo-ligase
MRRTFNCGVGMVVIVDAKDAQEAIQVLNNQGETAWQIGRIIAADADSPRAVQYV